MTHDRQDRDRLPARLHDAARGYNEPPALHAGEHDAMWEAIEWQAFQRPFASPSAGSPTGKPNAWWSARRMAPIAAALALGVAIGRVSKRVPNTRVAAATAQATRSDSVALPEPYQTTASRYFGQTAALLVALPTELQAGHDDAHFIGRAHDLLLTTRLLLDSPAAANPRLRTLLDDLELVLAQVVRLQSDQRPAELDLIRQALEQRDVLPRLRDAAADMSADD